MYYHKIMMTFESERQATYITFSLSDLSLYDFSKQIWMNLLQLNHYK